MLRAGSLKNGGTLISDKIDTSEILKVGGFILISNIPKVLDSLIFNLPISTRLTYVISPFS